MKRIGIAVLGLGWMGQAHSRSMLRIPSLFPERSFQPELVVCADTEPSRRDRAVDETGGQMAVFGRVGSRPFTRPEMEKLFLNGKGLVYKVSDAVDEAGWRPTVSRLARSGPRRR